MNWVYTFKICTENKTSQSEIAPNEILRGIIYPLSKTENTRNHCILIPFSFLRYIRGAAGLPFCVLYGTWYIEQFSLLFISKILKLPVQ